MTVSYQVILTTKQTNWYAGNNTSIILLYAGNNTSIILLEAGNNTSIILLYAGNRQQLFYSRLTIIRYTTFCDMVLLLFHLKSFLALLSFLQTIDFGMSNLWKQGFFLAYKHSKRILNNFILSNYLKENIFFLYQVCLFVWCLTARQHRKVNLCQVKWASIEQAGKLTITWVCNHNQNIICLARISSFQFCITHHSKCTVAVYFVADGINFELSTVEQIN